MWRTDSLEKTLMLRKIEGRRRRGRQRIRWLDDITDFDWHGHDFEQAPGVSDRQESLACCSPWSCKKLDMTEQLNWMLHQNIWDMGYWGEEKWPPPKDFTSFSGKMACLFSLHTRLFYHFRQKYDLIIVFTWVFWYSLRRYVQVPRWQGMDLWCLIL